MTIVQRRYERTCPKCGTKFYTPHIEDVFCYKCSVRGKTYIKHPIE